MATTLLLYNMQSGILLRVRWEYLADFWTKIKIESLTK